MCAAFFPHQAQCIIWHHRKTGFVYRLSFRCSRETETGCQLGISSVAKRIMLSTINLCPCRTRTFLFNYSSFFMAHNSFCFNSSRGMSGYMQFNLHQQNKLNFTWTCREISQVNLVFFSPFCHSRTQFLYFVEALRNFEETSSLILATD